VKKRDWRTRKRRGLHGTSTIMTDERDIYDCFMHYELYPGWFEATALEKQG